jgi:cation transport regulator ChaC
MSPASSEIEDVWVFGYGSLIWRPSFPFVERRRAWIRGWTRRLWQGSDDHRGVPGALGRVATLVESPEAKVLGVAYLIAGPEAPSVLTHLDHREKNGYERHEVDLLADDGTSFARGLLFIAGAHNPNFLGDAPLDRIVDQVARARGPSGPNTEYVVELARALRELGEPDPHLEEIAGLLGG